MILWSIECLLGYINMYNIGMKIPKWNWGLLLFVDDFVRICTEAVTVTDSVFMHVKLCIKLYIVNLDARVIPMKPKTLLIVIKLVSRHLDEHKNNSLIYKLHKFLSRQIWVCSLAWFLINHGLILWLQNFYGVYWTYRGVVL